MLIEKDELRRLIPHAGAMCLLDGVERWDADSILCSSATHRDHQNPLRRRERLAAVHALEYGAQAAAVHGGLLAKQHGEKAEPGFLAAFKDVGLRVRYLDDIEERLEVRAQRLTAGGGNQIYAARISAGGRELAAGRIVVMAAAR